RTPYLGKMYSEDVLNLFKETKEIFDPQNIFNPGKKVPASHKATQDSGGTLKYMETHIALE
ncbi:MAG: FAD-linked oxidase C-terminal domain-containing protein, partial [Parcubacteria group bacterium]